ncbi:MAG: hypothetical protein LBS59_01145 [Puniceicoccales bacterium]|jgi:hypothetical protein|nr:hypothetical protein [Puniceicoccales bacterium]
MKTKTSCRHLRTAIFFAASAITAVAAESNVKTAQPTPTPPAPTQTQPPTKTTPAPNSITDDTLNTLSTDEVRTLIRIVNLPQDKLESLRQSIDILAKMTPEEKQSLRKKLEQLRNAPPGARPPPFRRDHNVVLRYWRLLPPEKSREEQTKFNKMTREERREYVREILKKFPHRPPRPPQSAHPSHSSRPLHPSQSAHPTRPPRPLHPPPDMPPPPQKNTGDSE